MNVKKIIRIVVILVVLGTIGWFAWPRIQEAFLTEDDPNLLFSSGVVECVEVRVGTQVAGIITSLDLKEGDNVAKGDLIARIDTEQLEIQLQGALARVEQSQALLADARKGLRPAEIKQLEEQVKLKEALYERASIDFKRKNELAEKNVAPKNSAVLARKTMEAAKQDLEFMRQQIHIARLGARSDQIKAAQMSLRQAETAVNEIQKRIADAEVTAPLSGVVSIKNMEQGEFAGIGSTVVTIIDLEQPWVRIYIPENRLGRVKLGMEVEIHSDSYPDKSYTGVIRYISQEAEFTPKNVQTQEERVKLVYAAKVYLDNEHQEFKPGMPLDTWIKLNQ